MLNSPIQDELLFTKNDQQDPRLGEQVIKAPPFTTQSEFTDYLKKTSHTAALIGYADDEGIQLNGGRKGAQQAPDHIRRILYKMTPALGAKKQVQVLDMGNLQTDCDLATRHQLGRNTVASLCAHKQFFICVGGGHDYGYADACGFLDIHQGNAIVINFDAHLDVRPTEKGLHSGTPFYRMLQEFGDKVDFFEIGLQPQCNSQVHFDWAQQKGAHLYPLQSDVNALFAEIKKALLPLKNKKMFISLDIDVFASSIAPGCSQSWPSGLHYQAFADFLNWLLENFLVQGLGIYEVSPPLDIDNITSKLAAVIIHQVLHHPHILNASTGKQTQLLGSQNE